MFRLLDWQTRSQTNDFHHCVIGVGLFDRLFLYHKNGNKFAETTCEYDNETHFITIRGQIRGDSDIFHETIYTKDEKIVSTRSYKKQKRYGTHKIYNPESGKLKKRIKFKNGKKISTEKFDQ